MTNTITCTAGGCDSKTQTPLERAIILKTQKPAFAGFWTILNVNLLFLGHCPIDDQNNDGANNGCQQNSNQTGCAQAE